MNGPGPIPWTAVNEYAKRHGLDDPETFDDLVALVKAQDNAWLKYQAEQRQNSSSGQKEGEDRVDF